MNFTLPCRVLRFIFCGKFCEDAIPAHGRIVARLREPENELSESCEEELHDK
jgi:hypothetical protein